MSHIPVKNTTATTSIYTTVTLSWSAVPGAISYQIQYAERAPVMHWIPVTSIPAPTLRATITGLKVGTTYEFSISATT